ncbi:transglutaminase family protein isoform X2 [Tasmannia lanceolata]|uniref:transglutaminase family protein isoform X2 n=1 Tax=Tasmannia lanceolata TaxID=3420 RepID=UPI0040627ED6
MHDHPFLLRLSSGSFYIPMSSIRMGDCPLTLKLRFGHRQTHRRSLPPLPVSTLSSQTSKCRSDFDLEVLKFARHKFTQEISFRSKDRDISLAKALLFVAAEDEAFMDFNRDLDARSFLNERRDGPFSSEDHFEWDCLEAIPLAGRSLSAWLNQLDMIAQEVEAELVSRYIGCHIVEVLEAVNVVLFESRGFKRFSVLVDSKFSYLHTALSSRCGTGIILSIIYIEVCRRLGITIVGSRVGEEFLIWPQMRNPEELFNASAGHNLFAVINGRCVEDPKSKASDLNSKSLLGLDIATNRDIVGIALANLVRLHWKRASRMNHGLMLTSPLRPVHDANGRSSKIYGSKAPLVRPQDLRLAILASERLLILQPHNWALRRDHGMLLYFNRRYGEAVQELSICMAFAPDEEAEVLEQFIEKLHLLRLETSWKSLEQNSRLAVP